MGVTRKFFSEHKHKAGFLRVQLYWDFLQENKTLGAWNRLSTHIWILCQKSSIKPGIYIYLAWQDCPTRTWWEINFSQATAGTSQIVGKQKPAENNFHDICKIFCIKDVGLGGERKRSRAKHDHKSSRCFLLNPALTVCCYGLRSIDFIFSLLLSQSLQPGRYGFRWSDEGRVKQEAIFGGI